MSLVGTSAWINHIDSGDVQPSSSLLATHHHGSQMLQNLKIKNLTVFPEASSGFSSHLNVFIGENGAGKTHLLKAAYSAIAVCAEEGRKPNAGVPTKSQLQVRLAEKLVNVFRPEALGRLARRRQGQERCEITLDFSDPKLGLAFDFSASSKTTVNIHALPSKWIDVAPAYLPTRELLSIFPNFVSVYEGHYLELEETWRDTCLLLGAPLQRGKKEARIRELLLPLEEAMGGSIELDLNGRFYLKTRAGRVEMPLVAEGLRKLGMLYRLIATGAIFERGYLFWDEPEANLNPRLIKSVAKSIIDLSAAGIQVFIATHSLFLLRELEILRSAAPNPGTAVRYFGLHQQENGVVVEQGDRIEDMGEIISLDEELEQSDRFLELD